MKQCPQQVTTVAEATYRAAVEGLRKMGEIPFTTLIMRYDAARDEVDQVQTVEVYNLDTADKKDSAAQKLREFIQINNANCVVMIADAWVNPRESVGPYRENPQRKEAVFASVEIDGLGRWSGTRVYTHIGTQVFIEREMPTLEEDPNPNPQGRFVFFRKNRDEENQFGNLPVIVFKPDVLPKAEHDKMLADEGVQRVAYVQDASASELAAAVRNAGCPVAVMHVEVRDGFAHGHLCGIQPVRPRKVDGQMVVMAAHPGTGNPIAADELAGALEEHGGAKVVVEIDGHPHRLYSVLVGNGHTVITLNGRIDR